MRLNSIRQIARDARGAAVCGWQDDVTVGPYQKDVGGDTWRLFTRVNSLEWPVPGVSGGCNAIASSGGQWMRRLDGAVPALSGSQAWQPSTGRVGDIDGSIAVALDNEMVVLSVYQAGTFLHTLDRQAPFGGLRVKGSIAAWVSFPGPTVQAVDVLTGVAIPVRTLGPAQYTPVVFAHTSGLWALYQTDALGGVCHRVDNPSQGYRFGVPLKIYDPDVVIEGQGGTIGWSVDEGQFTQDTLTIPVWGAGMVPLGEPAVLPIHPDVMTIVRKYASMIRIPSGEPGMIDDQCRAWTGGLCETVRALFPNGDPRVGGEFGWKRASSTRPYSKETLALKVGSQLHGWDLLIGVGTGRPALSTAPAYHDLTAEGDQVFVPVPPIDHLTPVPSSHASLPVPTDGISAFDLGCRIAESDTWFLDTVVVPSKLIPRIIVASVYRTPRTLAHGRAQMPALLAALEARGVQCVPTLLTDTAKHGTTWDEALEHVRLMNEIMVRHAASIRAVRLANENSHAVEQAYLSDPSFLSQAAALIDARFPLSWGAGHGGEPVMGGGSYVTHHSDRSKTPEENAAIMELAEQTWGVPVVDDEPLGIAEPDRVAGRQRTSDPDWARRQAQASRLHMGLGGTTFHCDAGISCKREDWGPAQAAALEAFLGVLRPSQGHPLLDAPLTPAYPVGYRFFIAHLPEIQVAAAEWYRRAQGRPAAMSDIAHGLWRGLNEGERWGTLRRAWTETWGKGD